MAQLGFCVFKRDPIGRSLKGKENPIPGCMTALLQNNPELKLFEKLPPSIQNREKFFLSNSISGYIEFLRREQSY